MRSLYRPLRAPRARRARCRSACPAACATPISTAIRSYRSPRNRLHQRTAHRLQGWLHLPPGPGPFPCMITNHGSGIDRGTDGRLAARHCGAADVLGHRLLPAASARLWRLGGSGLARGSLGRIRHGPNTTRQLARRLDRESDDILAALDVVAALPEIDRWHIGVMGSSFGGVTTLLAAANTEPLHLRHRLRRRRDELGTAPRGLRETLMTAATQRLTMPIFFDPGRKRLFHRPDARTGCPAIAAADRQARSRRAGLPRLRGQPPTRATCSRAAARSIWAEPTSETLPRAASVTGSFDVVVVGLRLCRRRRRHRRA